MEAFGELINESGKLPKVKLIPDIVINKCEILGPLYEDGKISVSAIKNKLDRIFQVTLVRKT